MSGSETFLLGVAGSGVEALLFFLSATMPVRKEELIGLDDVRTKENYADETSEFSKFDIKLTQLSEPIH